MKTAFLFPGQGAQYPGMAKDLYETSPQVRTLFEKASKTTGKDLQALLFEGTEDDLKSTDNTQIAMTLANISAAAVLQEKGINPAVVGGFSVGEYAALYTAGVLDIDALFKAVVLRGQFMEAGSRASDGPEGPSGMSAVLGLPFDEAAPIVYSLADKGVFIANHSSPTQIVLAGTATGLTEAEEALEAAGAMKVVRLKVSGPFHSPLLESARKDFEAAIAVLPFADPKIPLFSNVTGKTLTSGEEARKFAGQQIVSTVRWVDCMAGIYGLGVERVLEVGPGKVLSGLWKSFTKDLRAQSAGTLEAIETLLQG
ncbi:MAG: ACP S-malonyltransferase [Spirochaetales bacterium]|nr:ACP S-malonyltransferase [Spirochaetales bacterium]